MKRRKIGSSRLAKFGIFRPAGDADVLITARDAHRQPLMTYAEAVNRLNDFPEEKHNYIVRKI